MNDMKEQQQPRGKAALIGGAIIAVDQASKYAIRELLASQDSSEYFFQLNSTRNTGAVFSFTGVSNLTVIIIGGIMLVALMYWFARTRIAAHTWALMLIIAGGVSNVVDRLVHGGVIDIAHLGTLTFNLADISIIAGTLLITFQLVRKDSYKLHKEKDKQIIQESQN